MVDLQRSECIEVDRGERKNAALMSPECTHHAIGAKAARHMLCRDFPGVV
ncbi:hypothetical protein [Paraburkholderia phytofirmans]|nr:hypothetical protein [Paraburkholderia phytofirmans]